MLVKRLQGEFEKRNGYYYEFDMHSVPLGKGGMGIVYKGFKIYETTGSRSVVAIKAMFDGLPADVYERAEREASIRLRNDNLVEMLGFIAEIEMDPYGKQKNKYYVISEFLNGVVLSDLLAGQFKDKDGIEIPYARQLYTDYISDREKTSVEIIRCVLAGIMALHDRKFIHRDIDPTNIMVTADGCIKLIDFGIAKYVGSLGSVDKLRTQTGKFIGKAEYASPELVLGDVENQGFHTDIYAIGILFYQLLVGRLPFSGGKYEILQKQLNNKVPVKHIKNSLLAKIVKKATEKEKSDRYSSAAELRVEIDKAIASDSHPFSKYWKRGIVAVLSSAACVGLIWSILHVLPPDSVTHICGSECIPTCILEPKPKAKLQEKFNLALNNLNSKDKITAKKGLDSMKVLAKDYKYQDALKELGITYYPHVKVQSSQIKNRRGVLGLDSKESEKISIDYLEDIAEDSASADVLYILGYNYWRHQNWEKGINTLSKAKDMLQKSSSKTMNGKPKEELLKDIQMYLDECSKQRSKK